MTYFIQPRGPYILDGRSGAFTSSKPPSNQSKVINPPLIVFDLYFLGILLPFPPTIFECLAKSSVFGGSFSSDVPSRH